MSEKKKVEGGRKSRRAKYIKQSDDFAFLPKTRGVVQDVAKSTQPPRKTRERRWRQWTLKNRDKKANSF